MFCPHRFQMRIIRLRQEEKDEFIHRSKLERLFF